MSFTRQWTADGVDIPGATGSGYTVAPADEGKVLRVRVTASKTGFASGTATSAATSAVVKPTIGNTGLPTVSDLTPEVGQQVTAGNGTWSETSGLSFGYQWTANGTDIAGADGRSYTVAPADEGKVLRVRVTASKTGFTSGTATSAATSAVVKPSIANVFKPTVSDSTPDVGQQVSAGNGTWSETSGLSFGYQWTANGTDIVGATGQSYTVTGAEVGKVLRVRVTASKTGFTSGTATSDPTSAVVDPNVPDVTNTGLPAITGTAKVGQVLTVNDGTWDPADATLTRQWRRNGAAIPGATGRTYTLTTDDLGKAITVTVTGSKAGHTSGTVTSAPTAAIGNGTITADKPTVAGKLKVGKTLTAKPGTSTPSTATVKYQWLRNGTAIRGATASKYKLTRKDKGKKISIKVTRTATGYADLVLKSAQTRAIKG